MKPPVVARELICEFVGTFALLFVVVAVSTASYLGSPGLGTIGAAIAVGLTIAVFATACGPVSGGQFNPAVSLGLLAAGRLAPMVCLGYILAQIGGGCAGAFAANSVFSLQPGNALLTGALPKLPPGLHPGQAYASEIILTFFLVFVIYGTAVYQKRSQTAGGLFIGATVTLCVLAGSQIGAAVLNPPVWFSLSAVSGEIFNEGILIHTVGPIIGGVIAACLWA